MKQNGTQKQNGAFSSLLGEATPAKASGWTYTLSATAVLVVSFLFVVALGISGVAADEAYATKDWYLYCSYLLSPLAFACVVGVMLRLTKTPLRAELKAQKCKGKYFLIAVLLQIGLLSLSELNSLFLEFLSIFGYEDTPINLPSLEGFGFVGVLLVVAVLPAIFEEWIFRGLLLKGMRSFGVVGAVLFGGLLFALYHQNPAQTIYQFCCGAAFALVALRAGSFLPTVLSHFINNALIVTLYKFGATEFPTPIYIVILCVSAVCLIGSLLWLTVFDKKIERKEKTEGEKAERKHFWLGAAVGIAIYGLGWLSIFLTGL